MEKISHIDAAFRDHALRRGPKLFLQLFTVCVHSSFRQAAGLVVAEQYPIILFAPRIPWMAKMIRNSYSFYFRGAAGDRLFHLSRYFTE